MAVSYLNFKSAYNTLLTTRGCNAKVAVKSLPLTYVKSRLPLIVLETSFYLLYFASHIILILLNEQNHDLPNLFFVRFS